MISIGLIIGILLIVFLIIFFIIMATKKTTGIQTKHNWSPLKIYFLLTTLVGVIWTLITLGILFYTVGKHWIITDDEYIVGERYYELDTCNQNISKPLVGNPNNYIVPTEEEKATCKAEKKVELIQARKVLFKEDLLSGWIRSILFIILLLIHYPRFMRIRKEGK